jgi:hypothetical protein
MSHPENTPYHTVFHEGLIGPQYDASYVIQSGPAGDGTSGTDKLQIETDIIPASFTGCLTPRHVARTLFGLCPLADAHLIGPYEVDPSSCTHHRECDHNRLWVLYLRKHCRWCGGGMSGGVSARVCALISSFGCVGLDGWLTGAVLLPVAFTDGPRWKGLVDSVFVS